MSASDGDSGLIGALIEQTYDELPYPELSHDGTHPGRLAAVAMLRGIRPAPPEGCRLLELGCAGGGNLVPMAFGLPGSEFVGIDLSARQIDDARQFAARVGVTNVHFQQLDLTDIAADFGEFDYIVAHGLYSWVPPAVRRAILAVCRRHLAPAGLAFVSYNTLPGWYPALAVRQLMRHRTRDVTDARQRVADARALVASLRGAVPESDFSLLGAELDKVAEIVDHPIGDVPAWADGHLLHDRLAIVNEPVYFQDFAEDAREHQLRYLGDADPVHTSVARLADETVVELRHIAVDPIEFEQFADFAAFQSFRRSVLGRDDLIVGSAPAPNDLSGLHLRAMAPEQPGGAATAAHVPATHVVEAAFSCVSDGWPAAIEFDELVDAACRRAGVPRSAGVLGEVVRAIGRAVEAGKIEAIGCAMPCAVTVPERPRASPIARDQVQRSSLVTSLRHDPVRLDGLARTVLPLLDGGRTRDDLTDHLVQLIDDGRMKVSGPADLPRPALVAALLGLVDTALRRLVDDGLILDGP